MYHPGREFLITMIGLLIGLGGCATSAPSRFYVLSAIPPSTVPEREDRRDLSILLASVTLPGHLERRQMVSRPSPNELEIAEFDRWAEPLEENVLRVLAENLSLLLGTNRVATFPRAQSDDVNYRVAVNVIRLDGKPGEKAALVARWTVHGDRNASALRVMKSSFVETIPTSNFGTVAAAQSKMLADLSREIAAAIEAEASKTAGLPPP